MAHTMNIPDFVRYGWQEETMIHSLFAHLDRHKIKYRIIGTAIILFIGFSSIADASTGIDVGAKKLYKKILNVGKWIIIIKGAFDVIKCGMDGDGPGVKSKLISYSVTYASLWALPWLFNEIDNLFSDDLEAASQ